MLRNIIQKIRLLFSKKDRKSYLCLYKILGFSPHNIEIYREALIHKSLIVKNKKGCPYNNERLEFLGDAILDAIITDILYHYFEEENEGFLTNTRSKIVKRETLNQLAVNLGLEKLVKTATHNCTHNLYMYGNALEAFIGAIYIDRGYSYCRKFIENRLILPYINLNDMANQEMNFKSRLIEWTQKNKSKISFELIEQITDKDSNLIFHTEVYIEDIFAGKGTGYSKKESQQKAAEMALERIKKDNNFIKQIKTNKALRLKDAEVSENEEL